MVPVWRIPEALEDTIPAPVKLAMSTVPFRVVVIPDRPMFRALALVVPMFTVPAVPVAVPVSMKILPELPPVALPVAKVADPVLPAALVPLLTVMVLLLPDDWSQVLNIPDA